MHLTSIFGRLKMTLQSLFTEDQKKILLRNGEEENHFKNHIPVARLDIKKIGYSFLITELYEDRPDLAFALCDYGTNIRCEVISLRQLSDLAKAKNGEIKPIEDFEGKYNLAVYAKVAAEIGTMIPEDDLFKNKFIKYDKGRNKDPNQDIRNLRSKLTWV